MAGHAKSEHQVPWLRITAEAVAIIGSILIAFALDAWWNSRIEEREIDAALEAVQTDLQVTRERLDSAAVFHGEALGAIERLLALTGTTAEALPEAEMDSLLQLANRGMTLEPASGAIRSLIQTGMIRNVSNDSLRSELTSWEDHLRDYTEDELWGIEDLYAHFRPYLGSRLPIFHRGPLASGGSFPKNYQSLLRDVEFANLLYARYHRLLQIEEEASEVRAKIDRIIHLIRRTS